MAHHDSSHQPSWLAQRLLNLRNKIQRRQVFSQPDIEGRFTKNYEINFWGDEESRSGSGSTMEYTANVRRMLPEVIAAFPISSMFDAPCGDFNWMRTLQPQLPIKYVGGDIVRPMIEKNQATYGSEKARFIHADITKDPFPAVDLWFCRDCLFHLSYADTRRALENFARSNVPYILTTTHVGDGSFANRDIDTGDFRPIDLFAAPYFMPCDVLFRFEDMLPGDIGREMCLWTREQVITALNVQKAA